MKYLFPGLLAGILLAFIPFQCHNPALSLQPQWTGSLSRITKIDRSPDTLAGRFALPADHGFYLLDANGGKGSYHGLEGDRLCKLAANGDYYASYGKTETTIDFYNIDGQRLWQRESTQYPALSPNARLVLLQVADNSEVRLLDKSGNPLGAGAVSGRFMTTLAFASLTDHAAFGFLDGSVKIVSPAGKIIKEWQAPQGCAIKSLALSDHGLFVAVHFGDTTRDGIAIITVNEDDVETTMLGETERYYTRRAMHVTDKGRTAFLGLDHLSVYNHNARNIIRVSVPESLPGHADIVRFGKVYAASWRKANGGSMVAFIHNSAGQPLLYRTFADEGFLALSVQNNVILARGADNLYCWSIRLPDQQ